MSSNGAKRDIAPGRIKNTEGKPPRQMKILYAGGKSQATKTTTHNFSACHQILVGTFCFAAFAQQHSHQFQQIKAPSLSTLSQLLLGTYGRDCTNNKRSRGFSPPHRRSRSLAKSKTSHAAGCAEWTLLKFFQPKVGNWHAGLSRHRSRCPKFTG